MSIIILNHCLPCCIYTLTAILLFFIIKSFVDKYKISRRNKFDFTSIITPLLQNMDDKYKTYIETRIIDQVNHYNSTSSRNKGWYQGLKITILILSAGITVYPVIETFVGSKFQITSILGGMTTVLLGIMQIKQYDRRYIESRMVCEYLKKETFLFVSHLKENDEADNSKLFTEFISKVENAIISECEDWKSSIQNKPDQK